MGVHAGFRLFGNIGNPLALFAAGEQGVWYDPSDFSTMFQDSAGTTPVTAVEQPVGLIRDKSGRGNHASQSTADSRPVLSSRVNQLLATATLATQSVTTLAATYTLIFSGAGTVTASGTNVGVYSAGSNSLVCAAGTLTLTVSGSVTSADLRLSNDGVGLPAYQAVVTSTNYDTSSFPLYLKFDGVNDILATGNIDFTATDKITTCMAFKKTIPAAGFIYELSSTANNGTFSGFVTADPYASVYFRSRGTVLSTNYYTYNSIPILNNTYVYSSQGNISNKVNNLRLNGVVASSLSDDQGTGNYGNYPLYIGARASNTFFFGGRIYNLIIRGAQSIDSQIAQSERHIINKTKAY